MIQIEFQGEYYNLPTQFSEVMLESYMQISNIDKEIEPIDKTVKIISILSGIDEEDIKNINLEQIKFINNAISFLFIQEEHTITEQVKIGGIWYGLNKNLADAKFGEYIFLEQYSSPEKINDNLHMLMAMLYRPVARHKSSKLVNLIEKYIYKRKNYDIEEYNSDTVVKRSEIFKKEMNIEIVLGTMFFFTILRRIIIENTQSSLKKKEVIAKTIGMMKEMKLTYQPFG